MGDQEIAMSLPESLKQAISDVSGTEIKGTTAVSGGDISRAVRVTLADERQLLIKWHPNSLAGMFSAEAKGLALLRSAETLRIPMVVAYGEKRAAHPAFIALEWLGRGSSSQAVAEALGRGLAQMHRVTATQYGLDHDNFIGANPQPNQQHDNWVTFFGEQRLGFQMELAGRNGVLPGERRRRLETLLARLGDWLPADPPASLLHGDLWGGNWLVADSGEPALIDPAVYYGHREAELAFTEMFGGFSDAFYAAYNKTWPLDKSYRKRKDLYNLYHLLNHLNLFGGGYGGSVDSVLRRYVG